MMPGYGLCVGTACQGREIGVDRQSCCCVRVWNSVARLVTVACPGILIGGGGSTNSVEDRGQRERGSGGGSPLFRGSGRSCNLVQEISFHIVKFS